MFAEPLPVLDSPHQLSTDWLTGMLQAAGELPGGRVESFHTRPNPAFNSAVVHVELVYSERSTGPGHIIVKVARNDMGKGEVEFYSAVRAR